MHRFLRYDDEGDDDDERDGGRRSGQFTVGSPEMRNFYKYDTP